MSLSSEQNNPNSNLDNSTTGTPNRKLLLLTLLTALLAIFTGLFLSGETTTLSAFRHFFGSSVARSATGPLSAATSTAAVKAKTTENSFKMKTPVYFLSHGGVSSLLFSKDVLLFVQMFNGPIFALQVVPCRTEVL